jgi:hypothetical protein
MVDNPEKRARKISKKYSKKKAAELDLQLSFSKCNYRF